MNNLVEILLYIQEFSPKLQSDFAREEAKVVAEAASRGLISSLDFCGFATNRWHLTSKGVKLLQLFQHEGNTNEKNLD
jgi:hypothetical protein